MPTRWGGITAAGISTFLRTPLIEEVNEEALYVPGAEAFTPFGITVRFLYNLDRLLVLLGVDRLKHGRHIFAIAPQDKAHLRLRMGPRACG